MGEPSAESPFEILMRACGWEGAAGHGRVIPIEAIARALDSLDVSSPERRQIIADQIMRAAALASFRPPPAGERITPDEILAAIAQIEHGLQEIAAGLQVLHSARSTVQANATQRRIALERVQRETLTAIATPVLNGLGLAQLTDEQIAQAMPTYEYLGFRNSWNRFDLAAAAVASLRATYSSADFRAPTRTHDEWFDQMVSDLAVIYRDATGKEPKAYRRGSQSRPDRAPPFVQFVLDLWPVFDATTPPPRDGRVADALKRASPLPPATSGQ